MIEIINLKKNRNNKKNIFNYRKSKNWIETIRRRGGATIDAIPRDWAAYPKSHHATAATKTSSGGDLHC